MVVNERDKRLFRHITNRNLLWQYDFLMDSIRIGLRNGRKLDDYVICSLNFLAVANLSDSPGRIRTDDVYIEGAVHEPPGHHAVKRAYLDFIVELHNNVWTRSDPLYVAAYVLWKISWIHPFIEGNGRTARAAMYYALSIKQGRMLKGSNPITAQMRKRPLVYYQHLRMVDQTFKDEGTPNLNPLVQYLDTLLQRQLAS